MVTFHFTLANSKKGADGKIPIYIRITSNRKFVRLSTGLKVKKKQWNPEKERVRKNHPNHSAFNAKLEDLEIKGKDIALKLQHELQRQPSAKAVKRAMQGHDRTKFFPYAKQYRDALEKKDEKFWSYRQVRPVIDKFKKFAGDHIRFKDITPGMLRNFESHLATVHKNKQNTIYKNLGVLRRIIRQAEEDGVIGVQNNPFQHYKLQKEKTTKERLSLEEIKKLEGLELEKNSRLWHARNYFLFSFYCAGIRFTDICSMQWKHIKDGRLKYTMSKTDQQKSIKLSDEAKSILKHYQYEDPDSESRVFPILPKGETYESNTALQKAIDSRNTTINNQLKDLAKKAKIEKNVTFHIARHSFAEYARKQDIDLYKISKALAHSSVRQTEVYLDSFDEESVDSVVDELFNKE